MIENEYKTPTGCLTFIFYQKYFFMFKWTLKAFSFSCDNIIVLTITLTISRTEENYSVDDDTGLDDLCKSREDIIKDNYFIFVSWSFVSFF